ncbi:hypothetical protein [Mucilaginibacter rubeus]|uniref:Uncharacterized protein n=1 Tax=Mucilaginibacter rubeus TaxID=2027860 RepID=A0A5C1I2M7_9SPHI|nr:hypothetical protein [Mucilaginibacter rubeus]QEM12223.1 hypothetical protein DEO27_020090 [Mucilaginibacter rubeus]
MIRRITAFLMAGLLLFGSVALPLGDFSLLKELPRMYQAYEKVVSPDEKGVLDFIGDYLLNGKDLLGHNQHDQPSKAGDLQFQRSAAFATIIQPGVPLIRLLPAPAGPDHHAVYLPPAALSDYHPSLFRPPLA